MVVDIITTIITEITTIIVKKGLLLCYHYDIMSKLLSKNGLALPISIKIKKRKM